MAIVTGQQPTIAAYGVAQTPTGTLGAAFNVIKYGTVTSDTNSAYATGTGLYTCPIAGWYTVSGTIEISHASIAVGNKVGLAIGKNGTMAHITAIISASTTDTTLNVAISAAVLCAQGDTLGLYSWDNGTTPAFANTFGGGSFSIVFNK